MGAGAPRAHQCGRHGRRRCRPALGLALELASGRCLACLRQLLRAPVCWLLPRCPHTSQNSAPSPVTPACLHVGARQIQASARQTAESGPTPGSKAAERIDTAFFAWFERACTGAGYLDLQSAILVIRAKTLCTMRIRSCSPQLLCMSASRRQMPFADTALSSHLILAFTNFTTCGRLIPARVCQRRRRRSRCATPRTHARARTRKHAQTYRSGLESQRRAMSAVANWIGAEYGRDDPGPCATCGGSVAPCTSRASSLSCAAGPSAPPPPKMRFINVRALPPHVFADAVHDPARAQLSTFVASRQAGRLVVAGGGISRCSLLLDWS